MKIVKSYDILFLMLVTAGKKVLSAMQVVMLLAPGVLTTPRKRQCCSGKRNFFDFVPFPGAFQAKGGMSNVSDRSLCSVVISLLALLVTVAKAAFDAGWKISHEKSDKNKED